MISKRCFVLGMTLNSAARVPWDQVELLAYDVKPSDSAAVCVDCSGILVDLRASSEPS